MRIHPSEFAMEPPTLEDALKLTLSLDHQLLQLFHHHQEMEPKAQEDQASLLQTLPLKLDPQVLPLAQTQSKEPLLPLLSSPLPSHNEQLENILIFDI